ncbi:MAG TPA: pantoate--beta-alanine ligase [Rudaea sp.]|nr:pantoate--beta-alanine ligase [Rudaea sp.]
MYTISDAIALRAQIETWRRDGLRIGFVPTMGNLHAGHYSLIEIARQCCDRVVASVFVNPTQFGPTEDFSSYPRTLDEDAAGLREHDCDVLFVPDERTIYPFGASESVRVIVPGLSDILDGAARPGHFSGVASVVTKLFNLVSPDVAVFGQKDYQQLLVIRRLVADLCLPISIVAAPIKRETNGLAMSSRNQYLTADERERASVIHGTLLGMCDAVRSGRELAAIEIEAVRELEQAGLHPDYAVLRSAADLSAPQPAQRANLIALIAARLGRARLIDNELVDGSAIRPLPQACRGEKVS